MATQTTQAEAMPRRGGSEGGVDAIELLTQEHNNVKELFEQYESLSDRSLASKRKLALKICLALTKHATAEEEIFYPAVRAASRDNEDLIDRAIVEHASAKELIAQIIGMAPGEDLYDATVKVLSGQIEHHVEEEESEMFGMALDAGLDLVELGAAIQAREEEVELPDEGMPATS